VPSCANVTRLTPAAEPDGLRDEEDGVYRGLGFAKTTVRGAFGLLGAFRFL
jgi:hypothetical protein